MPDREEKQAHKETRGDKHGHICRKCRLAGNASRDGGAHRARHDCGQFLREGHNPRIAARNDDDQSRDHRPERHHAGALHCERQHRTVEHDGCKSQSMNNDHCDYQFAAGEHENHFCATADRSAIQTTDSPAFRSIRPGPISVPEFPRPAAVARRPERVPVGKAGRETDYARPSPSAFPGVGARPIPLPAPQAPQTGLCLPAPCSTSGSASGCSQSGDNGETDRYSDHFIAQ